MNTPHSALAERERLSMFLASEGWTIMLRVAEEDVIRGLRAKVLTNAQLDPREQTGVVRALEAVRALLEAPYARLAESAGKPLAEVLPESVSRLFG